MNKGPFYYWSKNSMQPTAVLETLQEQCRNLSASYLQQHMDQEAEIFADAAQQFMELEGEISELLARRAARHEAEYPSARQDIA
ncbi:MAG TPA: hypothetical protein VFM49_10745 [Chloroflexia bacterium]|jgi:hypothetical protein|nr:hypothetical protein [Chloroflexia bacterium]